MQLIDQNKVRHTHQFDGLSSSNHAYPETAAESQSTWDHTFHTSNANLSLSKPNTAADITNGHVIFYYN